ncbi:GNAT family N-acetyltransferase [Flavobacterium alkalisoli]|nr:GNAT family N-acetyltransferase [Flavobacterium alkalisoli]
MLQKGLHSQYLFVRPDFRKTGIATQLLTEAKNYVRRNNGKGLALETAKDNPARALYEKMGWKQDRDYLHYYCTV